MRTLPCLVDRHYINEWSSNAYIPSVNLSAPSSLISGNILYAFEHASAELVVATVCLKIINGSSQVPYGCDDRVHTKKERKSESSDDIVFDCTRLSTRFTKKSEFANNGDLAFNIYTLADYYIYGADLKPV